MPEQRHNNLQNLRALPGFQGAEVSSKERNGLSSE